jgi:hypothetical protein
MEALHGLGTLCSACGRLSRAARLNVGVMTLSFVAVIAFIFSAPPAAGLPARAVV